jgi:hypothetical protein
MFLWNLHQSAAESPNSSNIFSVDSAEFFVLRFVQCRTFAPPVHLKRAHIGSAGFVSMTETDWITNMIETLLKLIFCPCAVFCACAGQREAPWAKGVVGRVN